MTGIILRILYIFYTDINTRQHDVEEFSIYGYGHGGYILYLFYNKHLPDFDPHSAWQFYHPPVHHIICALFLWIAEKLGMPVNNNTLELLQIFPLIYSILFCIISYKTLKMIGIRGKPLCYSTAFITFHPTLIIMSGSINNDMLSALLTVSAIFFTVKWSQSKKTADIIFTALSIGIGMCTKLTVGLIAPAVGLVFLYILIKNIAECKRLIPQFIIFGIICIPLGMCFPVRNYVKFGVPFNYVPKLADNSSQYINNSVTSRLFNFMPFQFSSPFVQWGSDGAPYNEFNPTIALWKTSVFDENTFFNNSDTLRAVCVILFFSAAALSLYSVYLLFKTIFTKNTIQNEYKLLITALSLTVFVNYIIFCINYPHVCTQNMRYCVPLIFTQATFLGLNNKSKFAKNAIVIFCISSLTVYTMLQF